MLLNLIVTRVVNFETLRYIIKYEVKAASKDSYPILRVS